MKTSIYLLNQRIERLLDVVNSNSKADAKDHNEIKRVADDHAAHINNHAERLAALENNLKVIRSACEDIEDALRDLASRAG